MRRFHPKQRAIPVALLVALACACGRSHRSTPDPVASSRPSTPGGGAAPGDGTPADDGTPEGGGTPADGGTAEGGGGTTPSDGASPGAPAPQLAASADEVYAGASPAALAAGRPGDVILHYPLGSLAAAPGTASLVLYRSTDALGNRIGVSGLVIVPPAEWAGDGLRPIVAFAHETVGVSDDCAPSRTIASGLYLETRSVASALARGWAVALTDYEGLGTPGPHTYAVNRSEAHAVLDSVRAAARLPGAGLDARAPVALWGYSQGGGAAAAAAEAAPSYAAELDLRGVVGGGVVADPDAVAAAGEGGLFYGFVAAASRGLDAAYPELDLESYLNDAGREAFASTESQCTAQLLMSHAFKRTRDYTTSDPRPTAAWQRRLAENKLGYAEIGVPALLYHGLFDEVIPRAVGVGLRDRWCDLGATVEWADYLGDHMLTQALGESAAVAWLAARFAGAPVQGAHCN